MATVNKNFLVKNGLVVQGSTATVNGNNILTESAGDSYILNLIGGTKSVTGSVTIQRHENISNFYDWMYKDATVYLKRKELKLKR